MLMKSPFAKDHILCTIYLAIFLCFASLFAHLSSILNNFNCNDENWILGK